MAEWSGGIRGILEALAQSDGQVRLEACGAAFRLLFRERRLYEALATTPREESHRLLQALSTLGEYLDYYENQTDARRDFACFCPLCRGEKGVHHRRVLDLALTVWQAHLALHAEDQTPENRLQEAAHWLQQAVALVPGQNIPDRLTLSWTAQDPLLDGLAQVYARCPQPGLNLIAELAYYFREGCRPSEKRRVAATFPLAAPSGDGVLAKLVLERTEAPFPGLYPHPLLLLTTRWDEPFARQFERAWQILEARNAAVRWELEPYRSEAALWQHLPLSGPSVGAALAVGLVCLLEEGALPPDVDCALTGTLEQDGRLGSVGRYDAKTLCFARYPDLRLVLPQVDHPQACNALPDWRDRLVPAATFTEARAHATRQVAEVKRYLEGLREQLDQAPWYYRGQRLSVRGLFTPLRVLVYKPVSEKRPGIEAGKSEEQVKPSDPFAEVQADLYELPLYQRDREEVRWQQFTRRLEGQKRAVLIGAPGSGKTFGTRHLVLTLVEQALEQLQRGRPLDELHAPVWLTARELVEAGSTQEALLSGVSAEALPWLKRAIEDGRAFIVVDALDELPEEAATRFRQRAEELDHLKGTVLVTCRTLQVSIPPWFD